VRKLRAQRTDRQADRGVLIFVEVVSDERRISGEELSILPSLGKKI
jgi:hypothetical protein